MSEGPTATPQVSDIAARLSDEVVSRMGHGVRVRSLQRMSGGHAGLTYGFELVRSGGFESERAIIKLGPRGVRRAGVADVYRQAELLQALHQQGFPAPALLWAEDSDAPLGSPYIVMQWVEGREHFPLLAAEEGPPTADLTAVWAAAAATAARLERLPVVEVLSGWSSRASLNDEFQSWEATLRKATDGAWVSAGLLARDALARGLPSATEVALVHGDFQPSNLLVARGRISAVIDWDLAHIGTAGLDLGWLAMFADPGYWGPHWRTWCPLSLDELVAAYVAAAGRQPPHFRWFHAYAGYRFGAIACLNVRLHRTGRRVDPIWERFALDIPQLFERARQLAEQALRLDEK